jgi:hypothetical protein
VLGAAGVGGFFWFLLNDDDEWLLQEVQPLVVDRGADSVWLGATIACAEVDEDETTAYVCLDTRQGRLERTLDRIDNIDGTLYYLDTEGERRSTLSLDTDTGEYFFEESGVADGEPYTVRVHGWLKEE